MRGAIVAANAAAGADDITLPAGTYTLTRAGVSEDASTGDLDITDELTITGAGARATSVVGGPAPYDDRIFDNHSGAKTTVTDLTITDGKTGGTGGGVANGGDLTLERVAVKDNTAGTVGGIYGIGGTLNLIDSTVSGNSSTTGLVGGVGQEKGSVNITNSTISGNKAGETGLAGGVVATDGALMTIRNSTIAFNESGRLGGGILTLKPGTLVTVKNTIVAGNSLDNCDTAQFSGGIISSQGNNISSDNSCPFTQPTDKQNTNPLLSPLQNNGGPTDTRALLPGSPAIDAGTNAGCPETDQRGVRRPQNGDGNTSAVCDVGAFERNDLTPPKVTTTVPSAGKTGVKRNTNLTANFSEQMDRSSLTKSTFKLFKVNSNGTTTQVTNVTVSSTTDGLKAVLNPFGTSSTVLAANSRYRAVLTTGAKDFAGNGLDQNSTATGSQSIVWTFTTGTS